MLVFCNYKCIPDIKNSVIFNLTSLLEGPEKLTNLIPPFGGYYDKEFDINYYNHIINNDVVFFDFMKIIISLYNGFNVIILISEGEIYDYIAESLQKMIQQRYGYNSSIIYEPDDIESLTDSNFTVNGLYNLDLDKERYSQIMRLKFGDEQLENMQQ